MRQVEENDKQGADKALLPFVKGAAIPTDSDPSFTPRPELPTPSATNANEPIKNEVIPQRVAPPPSPSPSLPNSSRPMPAVTPAALPHYTKEDCFFHVNRTTGIQRLAIPPSVAAEIISIAHGEGQPGFSRCYKILLRSWYIRGLTRILRSFIHTFFFFKFVR